MVENEFKYYVWLNALIFINTEFYGWNIRQVYYVEPKWFSRNQLTPFMANSSETVLKKSLIKQNEKSLQIMSFLTSKNRRFNC